MYENTSPLQFLIDDLAKMLEELCNVFRFGIKQRVHDMPDVVFEFEVVHSSSSGNDFFKKKITCFDIVLFDKFLILRGGDVS